MISTVWLSIDTYSGHKNRCSQAGRRGLQLDDAIAAHPAPVAPCPASRCGRAMPVVRYSAWNGRDSAFQAIGGGRA